MSTLFRVNGFIKLKKEEGIIDRALETLTSFVNAFEPSEPTVVLKNGWFHSQSTSIFYSPADHVLYFGASGEADDDLPDLVGDIATELGALCREPSEIEVVDEDTSDHRNALQIFFVASSPEEEHNYRKQRVVTEVMEILAPMFTEDTLQAVADLLRKDPL